MTHSQCGSWGWPTGTQAHGVTAAETVSHDDQDRTRDGGLGTGLGEARRIEWARSRRRWKSARPTGPLRSPVNDATGSRTVLACGLARFSQVHSDLPLGRYAEVHDGGEYRAGSAVTSAILSVMSKTPPAVTQADTIAALLDRSKRAEVPIRKTFVQQGNGKVRDPGPIAPLVSNHDERGLDLYLLAHAGASADPFDIVLPADTWARTIGMSATSSARSAVSKAFRRLEPLRLVQRQRAGSRGRVTLLKEDGHGDPYVHPTGPRDPYLKVPHAYWQQDWHLRLHLPGKAMLLIALSLDDGFPLPIERGPDWYGVSADTVQRGFDELVRHKLLDVDTKFRSRRCRRSGTPRTATSPCRRPSARCAAPSRR